MNKRIEKAPARVSRKVVTLIFSERKKWTLPLRSIAADKTFFIVDEGPGCIAVVRWDIQLGAWTFQGIKVRVIGVSR